MKNLYLYLFSCYLLSSCFESSDFKLVLTNYTDDTIFYDDSYIFDSITTYPIFKTLDSANNFNSNIILPHSSCNLSVFGTTWEETIYNECKDSTLGIYFFSKVLLGKYNKKEILEKQLYSKKEYFKVKDLENINWNVIYK